MQDVWTLHDIQLVLNSAGYMGMDIVVWQDDTISKFTWVFLWDPDMESSSMGSLMPLCLDEFTTWYAIIKLWCHLYKLLIQSIILFHTRVCQCILSHMCSCAGYTANGFQFICLIFCCRASCDTVLADCWTRQHIWQAVAAQTAAISRLSNE